jgi:hypothetical protein
MTCADRLTVTVAAKSPARQSDALYQNQQEHLAQCIQPRLGKFFEQE